jgi:hypothetical protein
MFCGAIVYPFFLSGWGSSTGRLSLSSLVWSVTYPASSGIVVKDRVEVSGPPSFLGRQTSQVVEAVSHEPVSHTSKVTGPGGIAGLKPLIRSLIDRSSMAAQVLIHAHTTILAYKNKKTGRLTKSWNMLRVALLYTSGSYTHKLPTFAPTTAVSASS